MATGPDLRIGDADREAVAARLREHYAQGRLTLEEFNQRLDAAFASTMRSQLSALTRDLPPAAVPPLPGPAAAPGARPERAGPERAGRGHCHRDGRSGRRPRLGMIPVVLAALMAWFLFFGLHLGIFPWPGKLAIFLVILASVRGLLRRLWRLGR